MHYPLDNLHVETFGDGPPLLMLHGWNRSGNDLRPLAEYLASKVTVHLFDLPGFGASAAPPLDGWDTNQYAQLIDEYVQAKAIKQYSLLGHSFGGRVSLRLGALHPESVRSITLIDSHGLRPIRTPYQHARIWAIKKTAKIIKFIDKLLGTEIFPNSFAKRFGSPDYQNAGILKNTFVKTISEDQASDTKKIAAPTLLLWGSEDKETPVAMGQRFEELITNAKLIVMPGKGHSPFHGVGSSLCANHIFSFLEKELKD